MNNKPVFWKQANGVLISVDNMDINHLKNVLKMILSTTTKKVYSGIIVQAESHEFEDECDATEIDIY